MSDGCRCNRPAACTAELRKPIGPLEGIFVGVVPRAAISSPAVIERILKCLGEKYLKELRT
jgi:hypothetical protein